MDAATSSGHAAPFSPVVTFIARYQETWWLSTQAGWLPVPPPIGTILDQHAQHYHIRTAATRATIRAVIALARDIDNSPSQAPR